MPTHRATCSCGKLKLVASGDPVRVSMCHCLDCQRRTGSTYGVQARFADAQVETSGEASVWSRIGDEGNVSQHHFCPTCGTHVWFRSDVLPGFTLVPVGAFADPAFPPPTQSWYEERRHPWVSVPEGALRG